MGRRLTEEEKAFIRESKWPVYVTRENFMAKFGWLTSETTLKRLMTLKTKKKGIWKYGGEIDGAGDRHCRYEMARQDKLRGMSEADDWRKSHR
jgi:hypothetical protein